MLRDSGTHYAALLEDSVELYRAYIVTNIFFHLVDKGEIKRITVEKAHLIIENKLSMAVVSTSFKKNRF
ncbi:MULTISPECIES: hypothetical protein [Bacillus cereus group]|uniref:hypothetical protein n=1 Tax=Bacillus cereus group TaxID=86661 RepID=UPI000BF1F420|nr:MULTISPECIES: hypothetical protein [Bacillus cereus group]PEK30276.1 hypothetical protein CN897_28230 [Bacillus toyonensis]PEL72606.1 hypothetical protein CN603_23725 [Bacillus toyonensis]